MNKRARVFLVIQCVAVTFAAGVCFALGEDKNQGTDAEDLSTRLREQGLLKLLESVAEESISFPVIHSEDYYKRVESLNNKPGAVVLGSDMLKELPKLRKQFREADEAQFVTRLSIVIKATHKILRADGYRNVVLGNALAGTIGQLLLEHAVLKEARIEELSRLAKTYPSQPISPERLLQILKEELGKIPSVQLPKGEGRRKAFFSIARGFLGSKAKTEEDVRGHLAFESDYGLSHNYDALDVLPIVGVILRIEHESDILTGLLNMKRRQGNLPDEQTQFVALCEKTSSSVINAKLSPMSGKPHRANDFWKTFNYVKTNKEWRTCFKEKE